MEDLIEGLFDLIFDILVEITSCEKVPKWIRYPLIIIITIFFTIIILGLFVLGILFLKDNLIIGLIFIFISILLLFSGIKRTRRDIDENKQSKD